MATKKKTRKPARRPVKKVQRRQPVVEVHRWFNPFHKHVHANLRRWMIIAVAILVLILGSTIFD